MKKLIAIFTLLALVLSLSIFGLLSTDAAAVEQEDVQQDVPSLLMIEEPSTEETFADTTEIIPEPINEIAEEEAEAEEEHISYETQASVEHEVVYATSDVHVRTGPGTEHSSLGILSFGNTITRTGTEDNGWSKVIFEDAEAYISSKYLSTTEPEVFFRTVEEQVYATTDVNMRTGPGTEYSKIHVLARGNSLIRTGIGDNGWSRLTYDDQSVYIASNYLSTSKPVEKETFSDEDFTSWDEDEEDYDSSSDYDGSGKDYTYEDAEEFENGEHTLVLGGGSGNNKTETITPDEDGNGEFVGRLTIPDVGVNVGLYRCIPLNKYASILDQISDAADSATYMPQPYVDGVIIGDHAYQGFTAMKKAVPYETYAYIDFGSYTQTYICIGVGNGQNTKSDMVDWNGNSLNYDSIPGGLAMTTCNDSAGVSVTISYWEPV